MNGVIEGTVALLQQRHEALIANGSIWSEWMHFIAIGTWIAGIRAQIFSIVNLCHEYGCRVDHST